MLNISELSGIQSSPISKNILENALSTSLLKDTRAYANYEAVLDKVNNSSFKAPTILFASGDGNNTFKVTQDPLKFYSANILARENYNNCWISSYNIDETFNLLYSDGVNLFKGFSVQPESGLGKLRSLELRNGNLPKQSGFYQLGLGYNETSSVNETGKYRHNIRTRHSSTNNNENAVDIFLWDRINDTVNNLGSRRVLSLYGTGNIEIATGSLIYGPLSIDIDTPEARVEERNTLAVQGRGVFYYNQQENRFRFSENGQPFQYISADASSNSKVKLESTNISSIVPMNIENEAGKIIGVYLYSEEEITISKISTIAEFTASMGSLIYSIYKPGPWGEISIVASNGNKSMNRVRYGSLSKLMQGQPHHISSTFDPLTFRGWICVLLSNNPSNTLPIISGSHNLSQMVNIDPDDITSDYIPLSFMCLDTDAIPDSNAFYDDSYWASTIDSLYKSSPKIVNTTLTPYIKLS